MVQAPGETRRQRCAGAFTLIELLVVVIIVGILAAAAVPLYLVQADRARMAEAIAGLGAIRSMQTIRLTETGEFVEADHGEIFDTLGLNFSENAFFDTPCFRVDVTGTPGQEGYTFIATADGGAEGNDAPRASEVANIVVQMARRGELRYSTDGGNTWSATGGPWPAE